MATKAPKNAPEGTEPQVVDNEKAVPAAEPNDATEGDQDESKVVFLNPQDFQPDAEDLEGEEGEEGQTLKITFPNGEVYEVDKVLCGRVFEARGIVKEDVNSFEDFFNVLHNLLCWNDFGLEGRTPGYDYADNWLRAIKEVI